ncbi:MAG: class I SAM-dependent methyltransferase [Chloroflexota bacterium]
MEKSKRYSAEEVGNLYNDRAGAYNAARWVEEKILGTGRLRSGLLPKAVGNVLDVACGGGANFRYLKEATSITGVDVSEEMLGFARREGEKLGIYPTLTVMDAANLQFEDGYFDTVISTLSTCTFPDPIKTLQEMGRVAKPGGRILLMEHGRSRWEWVARFQDRRAGAHYERSGCRWNQEPEGLVAEAGLKIVGHRRHLIGIFHAIEVAV